MGHFSCVSLNTLRSRIPWKNCVPQKSLFPFLLTDTKRFAGCHSHKICRGYAAVFVVLLSSTDAIGQPVTSDAAANQELLREQSRARELRAKQEPAVDVHLVQSERQESVALRFNESPCFVLNEIVITGDDVASFNWALSAAGRAGTVNDSAIGRCVGTSDIQLLARRVQNEILRRGYITTRVLLEPQDLNSGTLTLTLIPGRLRSIQSPRENEKGATTPTMWNAVPVAPGRLLNLRDIEQALENFKRVPTVQADFQIVPAEGPDARPGESDLVIKWNQDTQLRANVSVDDAGSRATGKHQGSITIAYDNLLHLNDLFYATLSRDLERARGRHGTRGAVVHYSVPFDYWLLGVTGSSNPYYQSVDGATQTYVYRGESRNANISLSRLIFRDATQKIIVSLAGWARASRNYIDDTEVEVQRRRMAGWEVGVTHRRVTGERTAEVHFSYRHGTGAANALRAPEEAFGEGTSRFAILTADGSITSPIAIGPLAFRYAGTWRIQRNRTPLIVQDRFAIGGRYTVRGFDGESSLVAERGWLLRNELAVPLGSSGHELYSGLDYGKVSGPSSAALVGRSLTGSVFGLRGAVAQTQYDIFLGVPVRKPQLFRTARLTWGFSVNANF